MKYSSVCATICVLVLLAGCSQSPEKLLTAANKYHQNKKYQEASILYRKVLLKDKTNAEAYYREGLNLLDQAKVSEAASYLRRAVDLRPSNTDAAVKLSEIYLAAYSQDPKKFKTLLSDVRDLDKKILLQNGESFDGLRIEGLLQIADKQYDKAVVTLAKANRLKPHSRNLVGWYAEALVADNNAPQAVSLMEDMVANDKTFGAGYDFLFLQHGRAGDRAKAEAVLRDRVKNDPANPVGYQNLANYLLASNRAAEAETMMRHVLDDQKSFPNAHEIVGDFYVRAKKYDQALAEYQQGEKDDPKNSVKYQERIVALHAFSGRTDQASQMAKDLAQKNPKDLSANEMYASLLLQSGSKADASKSLSELKKLAANNPTDPVLHLDLARAYFGVNDRDKALSEALEVLQTERKTNPRLAVVVPARIVAARVYEDRALHAKAMEQANMALSMQPGNPDASLIRCRALIGINDMDKALPELEELVKKFPQMNDARLQLGGIYLAQRQYDKAEEQFQAVAKATPPDIRGFLGIQTLRLATGKSAQALQAMQDLVDKNPTNAAYRYQLANFQGTAAGMERTSNAAHAKQLIQQAADNYKEILKTSANSADVWLRLGVMQRELGQLDAASASFEQASNADPKNPQALLNRAMLLEATGKKSEAHDAYNKVLALQPENALALNNLAYLNADSGKNLDQAMTFAQRAKQKAPDNPDVSDTLGYVYYQKNLNSEALRIFRQNVQDHPQNSMFHFHLAMALLKQGDKEGAREEATKALTTAVPAQQDKIRSFVSQIG
jgi:tetratricopeptide (TPR) repeat protein